MGGPQVTPGPRCAPRWPGSEAHAPAGHGWPSGRRGFLQRTQNRTDLPHARGPSPACWGFGEPLSSLVEGKGERQGGTGRALARVLQQIQELLWPQQAPGRPCVSGPQWGRASWAGPAPPRPARVFRARPGGLRAAASGPVTALAFPRLRSRSERRRFPGAGWHFLGGRCQLCPHSAAGPGPRPGRVPSPASGCWLHHRASGSLPRARAGSSWEWTPGRGSQRQGWGRERGPSRQRRIAVVGAGA